MATKDDLKTWLVEALEILGGRGTIVAICRTVWDGHAEELTSSGNLFYTWQYDIRWAANRLRREGVMKSAEVSPEGIRELAAKQAE